MRVPALDSRHNAGNGFTPTVLFPARVQPDPKLMAKPSPTSCGHLLESVRATSGCARSRAFRERATTEPCVIVPIAFVIKLACFTRGAVIAPSHIRNHMMQVSSWPLLESARMGAPCLFQKWISANLRYTLREMGRCTSDTKKDLSLCARDSWFQSHTASQVLIFWRKRV
jgi:hypothetical protein